ncbi:MAG: DUF4340 domain-containing protein [Pirellulales bacterium]|nr:DUF4340 domain-containing protein [Pirellulales bacterium]
MSEMAKTFVFVAAAAGSLLLAFVVRPGSNTFDPEELVGIRLNQFEVDDAKRLKIVKYDSETASTRTFEITETDGLWTIPSKRGYPADANKRMAEAVNNVIDREILRIASKSAGEHETLGVLNPEDSKLTTKSTGAGTRVVISDSSDNLLADMIIGKPVPESKDQYNVRDTDKDVVYVVNLNPDNLSTSFKDWIEGDLLQLSALDLRRLEMKDYSAELRAILTPNGFANQVLWDRRGEMTLEYDNSASEWNAAQLQKFDPEKEELVDYDLTEDEELDKDVLTELRNSLEDLKIVDVERKPEGLSADLHAGANFLNDSDARSSLTERGFATLSLTQGAEPEILSSEGQLTCSMKNGVEYVLRFGNLKTDSEESSATPAETDATAAVSDVYRYLFVMARFNGDLLDRAEVDPFPSLPEGISEDDLVAIPKEASSPQQPAADTAGETAEVTESGASNEETVANSEPEETRGDDETADPGTAPNTGEGETATARETEAEPQETAEDKKKSEVARILAEREEIKKENNRRQDEYEEKIEAGEKRVAELNERFGEWYYVIDNSVYKSIHLGRDQVIRAKEDEDSSDDDPIAGEPE